MTEYRKVAPSGLGYLEYVPADEAASDSPDVPTLVFLHGLGEHGCDLDLLKAWGLPKLICAGLHISCHVLCPQCPEGADWDLGQLAELMGAQKRCPSSPLFLTGYSRGATAAWRFAARFGHLLTGVIPVAGRWDLADATRVAAVPMLVIHGGLDERPSPAPMVEAIARCGGEAQLWLLEGQGHFISDTVYANEAVYDWIASRASSGTPPRGDTAPATEALRLGATDTILRSPCPASQDLPCLSRSRARLSGTVGPLNMGGPGQ